MRTGPALAASLLLSVAAACSTPPAPRATDTHPATTCPDAVVGAIARRFPGAAITSCKPEHEDGHDQLEVKLADPTGVRTEVDVAPDGAVLQIEEECSLDRVPAPILAAFAAKYPGVTAARAQKQTHPGQGTTYELAFAASGKSREITFAEDGRLVGEE